MKIGIDFFGISEEVHRELSMLPIGENENNSFAEFNRERGELEDYMDALHVIFKIREDYMSEGR